MPNGMEDFTSKTQERVRFLERVVDCEGHDRSAGSCAWVDKKTARELFKAGSAIKYTDDLPKPEPTTEASSEGARD